MDHSRPLNRLIKYFLKNSRRPARILSVRKVQLLGRTVGDLIYLLSPPWRRVALSNLKLIHPEWSPAVSRDFVRKVFRHFGINLVEMLQMSSLSHAECLKSLRVEGAHHLERAVQEGRGAIILSAHIGNWEAALQLYPLYFRKPLLGVAKPVKASYANQWLSAFRARFGNQFVDTKGALREMTRTLRQGGAIGIMIDMNRQKQGLPIKFLGHDATATPAAAMLALRCKSPVVLVFCIRDSDGGLVLKINPPIPMRRTGDLRRDLQFNTQRMTHVVEDVVRQYPEQWYWMQKRWKFFYPELYPEYFGARRRRKQMKAQARIATKRS
jgi:KDO2-lipid IV(A) lauroyltransferase